MSRPELGSSYITGIDVDDDLSNAPAVRPEFTGTLAIKAGRHPILSVIKTAGALVPNDTYCSDSSKFQLIRGPKLSATICVPVAVTLPFFPLVI